MVIGMFKGAIVAVTLLIFKRVQTYSHLTPQERAQTVTIWMLKERSFVLIAWGYQTFSCFFVFCLVTAMRDKPFVGFVRAVFTGMTFAFVVKPCINVGNHFAV